jgi:WD domain, G-beta repeat
MIMMTTRRRADWCFFIIMAAVALFGAPPQQPRAVVAFLAAAPITPIAAAASFSLPKDSLVLRSGPIIIRSNPWRLSSSSRQSNNNNNDDDLDGVGGGGGGNQEAEDSAAASAAEMQSSLLARSLQLRQSALQAAATARLRQPQGIIAKVAVVLPDWIRRIAVDYPLVACGTASSQVYLAHLETGVVLAETMSSSSSSSSAETDSSSSSTSCTATTIDEDRLEHVVQQLYGQYDGGGTLAIGMSADWVAASDRTGGVTLYRIIIGVRHQNDDTKQQNDDSDSSPPVSSSSTAKQQRQQVQLVAHATLHSDDLVTAIQMTSDNDLVIGTDTGSIHVYELDDYDDVHDDDDHDLTTTSMTMTITPTRSWQLPNAPVVTAMAVQAELGMVAVATDSGPIYLLDLEDDDDEEDDDDDDDDEATTTTTTTSTSKDSSYRRPLGSFTPPFDGTERRAQNVFPTSVAFVECSPHPSPPLSDEPENRRSQDDDATTNAATSFAIVCGGNDGSLYVQHLALRRHQDDDDHGSQQLLDDNNNDNVVTAEWSPFATAATTPTSAAAAIHPLLPRHLAPVQCLTSPGRDLVFSGGQDGSVRMWDVREKRLLYQFRGYKVWLGSLWTDGQRLCSDGSDNTIVLHKFTASPPSTTTTPSSSSSTQN